MVGLQLYAEGHAQLGGEGTHGGEGAGRKDDGPCPRQLGECLRGRGGEGRGGEGRGWGGLTLNSKNTHHNIIEAG